MISLVLQGCIWWSTDDMKMDIILLEYPYYQGCSFNWYLMYIRFSSHPRQRLTYLFKDLDQSIN